METNKNKNTMAPNPWDTARAVLERNYRYRPTSRNNE